MFNNVMSDILEMHIKDYGKKENPVYSRMKNISTMLLVKLELSLGSAAEDLAQIGSTKNRTFLLLFPMDHTYVLSGVWDVLDPEDLVEHLFLWRPQKLH